MNLRVIPRTAIDSYLRLVRLPLDGAIGFLPGDGTGAKPAARLAVDRVDATLRALIATIVRDPALRADAEQRQEAARAREQAYDLRTEADRKADEADARLAKRQVDATRQREQAARREKARRQEAARDREKQRRSAAEAESKRLDANRETAERTEEVIDEQAPGARLEAIRAKSDALEQKEKELTARDEAARLSEAASRAKAQRKAANDA